MPGSKTNGSSNSDVVWDTFNSTEYFLHNYDTFCDEDQAILEIVRDFFAANAGTGLRGVDVGGGTNLYPALSMLPWCDTITLVDRSTSNVAWLRNELTNFKESWDPYWELLRKNHRYGEVIDPRSELRDRAKVVQGDVFNLPSGCWDIGTMFFVACSMSSFIDEFTSAVEHFFQALRPGSPFAMAFMEESEGYEVGGQPFPAVSLTVEDVRGHLTGLVDRLTVVRVPAAQERLRPGYTGMLVANGRTRKPSANNSKGDA